MAPSGAISHQRAYLCGVAPLLLNLRFSLQSVKNRRFSANCNENLNENPVVKGWVLSRWSLSQNIDKAITASLSTRFWFSQAAIQHVTSQCCDWC